MNKLHFAFGLLLPCIFISGLTGFSIESNWYVLWVGLPLMLLGIKIKLTPAHVIGAGLLLWAALSVLWAPSSDWAIEAALKLGAATCAFLVGAEVEEDTSFFKGLAVGIGINSCVAIAQSFGYATGITGGTAAGLLYNGNALAIPAALVALVLTLDGRILWALPVAPAILLPGTRAGLFILGVGLLAWLWQRSKRATLALTLCLALVGGYTLLDGWRIPSTHQRVAIWADTASGLSLFGHGLGSFGHSYGRYATRINLAIERPFHAHSDPLEVTFEFGYIGLALFLAFLASCLALAQPRERILFTAAVAISAIDFPLYVPTSCFIIALLAGRAASGWRERRVAWMDRGSHLDVSRAARGSIRADAGQLSLSI